MKNGMIILSLIVAFVIVGCQKRKHEPDIKESFYAGGQLKSRVETADGKLNGKAEYYFENGAIETEGSFAHNLPVGLFVSYFENGNVKSRAYYKDGKQDSITEVFNVNNALIWKAHYRSGKIVGNSYYFDDHGVIKEIKRYDSTGNIAYITVFNKEGKVKNKFVYPRLEGPTP